MKLLPKHARVLHPLPRVDEVRLQPAACSHTLVWAGSGSSSLSEP